MAIENAGYRPEHNLVRWAAIEREVRRDRDVTCLEIGSNFGFISSSIAKTFQSRVFSIEGSFGTGNAGTARKLSAEEVKASPGIQKHLETRAEHGLSNNIICPGLADAWMFERLLAARIVFDYAISLSVFHWVVDASKGYGDDRRILANHLRIARTTFMELPAMTQGRPLPNIYRDYATIPQAISQACPEARITYLCSCDWYGTRDTYRIDMPVEPSGHSTEIILAALGLAPV